MYIINSKGPITSPGGTPPETDNGSDIVWLTTTISDFSKFL